LGALCLYMVVIWMFYIFSHISLNFSKNLLNIYFPSTDLILLKSRVIILIFDLLFLYFLLSLIKIILTIFSISILDLKIIFLKSSFGSIK